MGLALPPHPDGPLPLHYTAACERCRPRLVRWFDTERQRDDWADAHARTPDHPITRGTARARRQP